MPIDWDSDTGLLSPFYVVVFLLIFFWVCVLPFLGIMHISEFNLLKEHRKIYEQHVDKCVYYRSSDLVDRR